MIVQVVQTRTDTDQPQAMVDKVLKKVIKKREELFLLNCAIFTALLWYKLDYPNADEYSWAIVCLPLWIDNILGMLCGWDRIRKLQDNFSDVEYNWWPQTSKNAFILALEAVLEELLSAVQKASLLILVSPVPYILRFVPLWLSACLNVYLYTLRRPRFGVVVKPRYVFAMIVCMKLDGWNDFAWQFQFAPLWFLLSVVFCCVLLFTVNISRRTNLVPLKRKAFLSVAVSTLLVTVLVAFMLVEFARYLEHQPDSTFTATGVLALLAQGVAYCGLFVFTRYIRLDREASGARGARNARGQDKSETSIVLDFIQTPEDVFVRESANLFRKHVPTNASAVTPNPQDFEPDVDSCEECIICCIDKANYIMLECGHGNFCEPCCKELAKRNFCPMCRQPISRVGKLSNKKLTKQDSTFVLLNSVAVVTVAPKAVSSTSTTTESSTLPVENDRESSIRLAMDGEDSSTYMSENV